MSGGQNDGTGGQHHPMPCGAIHSATQTGVVGGAENKWTCFQSTGYCEMAAQDRLNHRLILPEVLVMSKTSRNRPSAVDQALMRRAARNGIPVNRTLRAAAWKVSEEPMPRHRGPDHAGHEPAG